MSKKLILAVLVCLMVVMMSAAVVSAAQVQSMVAEISTAPGPISSVKYSHSGPSNCFDKPTGGGNCALDPPYPNGRFFATTYTEASADGFFPEGSLMFYGDASVTPSYCGEGSYAVAMTVGTPPASVNDWDLAAIGSPSGVQVWANPSGIAHWPPAPGDTLVVESAGALPQVSQGAGTVSGIPVFCEASTSLGPGYFRCGYGLNYDVTVPIYFREASSMDYIQVTSSPDYSSRPILGWGKGTLKVKDGHATMSINGKTNNPSWWSTNNGGTVSLSAVPLIPRKISGTASRIDVKELPSGDYLVKFLFQNANSDPRDQPTIVNINSAAKELWSGSWGNTRNFRFSYGAADFAIGSIDDPVVMANAYVYKSDFAVRYNPFADAFTVPRGYVSLVVPRAEYGVLGTSHWVNQEFMIGFPNPVNFAQQADKDQNGQEADFRSATLSAAVSGNDVQGNTDAGDPSKYEIGYGIWIDNMENGEAYWFWIEDT